MSQPVSVQQALQIALQHHQAGQLAQAEKIYRQILSVEPDNPDALNLLGVLAHQSGKDDDALGLISRAIRINDAAAPYHVNLGTVHQAQGRIEAAVTAYRR